MSHPVTSTEAASGPHTPITNIPPSETTVAAPELSPGSSGFGDELEVAEGAAVEAIPKDESESFEAVESLEFVVPDLTTLSDIGEASFGPPPQFEAVIGTDERVRIKTTKQYPWRVIASLLITAADNSQWIGTGWFISPRTLVTAGHCVYIKNSGVPGRDGWVKKIQVMPGRNGSELPYGGITATEFFSVKGWGDQGSENYDYGAIILPSVFPQDLGFYSFGVFDDARLMSSVVNIAGYPGDKPKGTLWYDSRQVGSVNPDKVFYAADTAGGQSGTVVYVLINGKRVGVAIHTYGGATANSGTRISTPVYSNLQAWKRT
jgi:V8-like Glu-specific endopeptidase